MSERESKRAGPATVGAIVLVLLMVGAYVAGYFWLGATEDVTDATGTVFRQREYRLKLLAEAFVPMAEMEHAWIGGEVVVLYVRYFPGMKSSEVIHNTQPDEFNQ